MVTRFSIIVLEIYYAKAPKTRMRKFNGMCLLLLPRNDLEM